MKYEAGVETKNLILRVAFDLFLTRGFNETSIRTIAKESYISSGALYNHFKNKEDILNTIIDPYIEAWWDECEKELFLFESNLQKYTTDFVDISSSDNIINLLEENIDIWRFVFFKSKGTKYENFIYELIEWEYQSTTKLLEIIDPQKTYLKKVSEDEIKFFIEAYFETCLNTFKIDTDAKGRRKLLTIAREIYNPFWESLFDLNNKRRRYG